MYVKSKIKNSSTFNSQLTMMHLQLEEIRQTDAVQHLDLLKEPAKKYDIV